MRRLRPYAPALLAVALVTLASWPVVGAMHPRTDLDGAWTIALRQVLHDGLDWGPDVLFTYGPLGFLREPLLVYPWSARLAFAWVGIVQVVLAATLLWGLRHAFRSSLLAVLLAIPLGVVLFREPTMVIAFAGAVALAAGRARGRAAQGLALALGVLCGIEGLAKLNTGAAIVALCVIALAVAPSPRRRLVAPFALAAAVTAAIGWFATGQSVSGIGDYLSGVLAIVSGYSEAMAFEDPKVGWENWVAPLLAAVGFVVAWRAGEALPRRARLGLLALWAVLAFTTFKAGFVRHDPAHSAIFFASLLGGLVAFGWAPHRRQTAWLLGALFAIVVIGSNRESPRGLFAPIARTQNFFDQARVLTDGSATNAGIAAARAERAAFEQLDARFVGAIGDRSVHVEPIDTGLVWAHQLRWKPLPVFQSYSAYTESLDERNAEVMAARDGPEVVMREATITFDNRNPAFESPAAMRALLCHFRPALGPFGRWLMLERSAPRCGPERPLATVEGKLGDAIAVPPAPDRSSVVLVRIEGVGVTGLEKLRTALYRALPRTVTFDGGRFSRLVPGTAGDGIVLRVPPRADHPEPFRLDQATNTITVDKAGREGDVRLRFSAMSIR